MTNNQTPWRNLLNLDNLSEKGLELGFRSWARLAISFTRNLNHSLPPRVEAIVASVAASDNQN